MDNGMTNHTGVISAEYDAELSRLIEQFAVYDKGEIGQRHDQSYRSAL